MQKSILVGLTLSAFLAAPATAADMAIKAPARAAPAAFTWTSCYIGAHVGGGWGRADFSDPDRDFFATPGDVVRVNTKGVFGGGQVGCDWQLVSNWVIGVEGAVAAADITGSTGIVTDSGFTTGTLDAKTDLLASLTGRVGWAFDRLMFFGKGGVAWAHNKYGFSGQTRVPGCFTQTGDFIICALQQTGTPFDFNESRTETGWTAGGGVEWAALDNWSVKVEYDFYDFGNERFNFVDRTGNFSAVVPVDVDLKIHTVRFGLNYRFSPAP